MQRLLIRELSSILHYRPSTNLIVNYITGAFARQHDVDIISDKEISIFDNNYVLTENGIKILNSEVLIYNFETKSFSNKFNNQLKENNIKTATEGLVDFLNDGSMMVEEQNYGRILFFNKKGELEWEFINKADNGKVYIVTWSRFIKDKNLIDSIKNKIKNTTCKN